MSYLILFFVHSKSVGILAQVPDLLGGLRGPTCRPGGAGRNWFLLLPADREQDSGHRIWVQMAQRTDEYVDEDDLNRERRAERQRALERGREIDERLAEERRPLMSKDTSE